MRLPSVIRRFFKTSSSSGASFDAMNHDMVAQVFGGATSTAGKQITNSSVMSLSAAWACMRILAETIGSLPWGMYRRDAAGNATKIPDHALHMVLANSPNRDMTSTEFREAMTLNLCQSGNAYALIERVGGQVVALYPTASSRVQMVVSKAGVVTYKVTHADGYVREYAQQDVWHVKGFGTTGFVGLSPIAAARDAMGFALAVDEFGARFFAQGGKPSGTVTIPAFLSAEQRKIARENLQQLVGGMGNMHKFALFEGGMKPEPWGEMPLDDMQFLMLRKFSVQEICRFYRVPPHMVADLDKATFSNIEQQAQEFVNYTLLPYFTRFESSAAKWLISPEDRAAGYFLRFNAEGLLRGDSAARASLYSQLLQNGVTTRNEVRALENLNASTEKGMDDFTVQSNLVMVSELEGKVARDAAAQSRQGVGNAQAVEQPKAVFVPPSMHAQGAKEVASSTVINLPAPVREVVDLARLEALERQLADAREQFAAQLADERKFSIARVDAAKASFQSVVASEATRDAHLAVLRVIADEGHKMHEQLGAAHGLVAIELAEQCKALRDALAQHNAQVLAELERVRNDR